MSTTVSYNLLNYIRLTFWLVFSVLGPNCELEDHCASGPCKNGAECASKDDSYECTCAPGFTGTTCSEDIEECSTTEPCVHGQCVNTHGSYA